MVVEQPDGQARFASLDEWLYTEIRGWTLADRSTTSSSTDCGGGGHRLSPFVGADGAVSFPAPALIATATAA